MAKKVKAPMIQRAEEGRSVLELGFTIPGIAFRWVNADVRNQMANWRHWSVVERDSDLGQKIEEKMSVGHEKFSAGNEGNYFSRGQLKLAWAPEEVSKESRERMIKKADDRLRQVAVGSDGSIRNTYISTSRN